MHITQLKEIIIKQIGRTVDWLHTTKIPRWIISKSEKLILILVPSTSLELSCDSSLEKKIEVDLSSEETPVDSPSEELLSNSSDEEY